MFEPSSLHTPSTALIPNIESFFSKTIQPSLRSIVEQGLSGAVDKINDLISLIVKEMTIYPSNIELQQLHYGLDEFRGRLKWNIEQWEKFAEFVKEEDNNSISLIEKLERLNPCTLTAPATAPETSVTPISTPDSTTSPSSLPVSSASIPASTEPSSSIYRTYDEVKAEFDGQIAPMDRSKFTIDVVYFRRITSFLQSIPANLKSLETSEERQKAFFYFLNKLFRDKDDFKDYVDSNDAQRGRRFFISNIKTLVEEVNKIDPAIFTGKSLVALINYQFFSNPDLQLLITEPTSDEMDELIAIYINSIEDDKTHNNFYELAMFIENIKNVETQKRAFRSLHQQLLSTINDPKRTKSFAREAEYDGILHYLEDHYLSVDEACKLWCAVAKMYGDFGDFRCSYKYLAMAFEKSEELSKESMALITSTRADVQEVHCRIFSVIVMALAESGNFTAANGLLDRLLDEMPLPGANSVVFEANAATFIANIRKQINDKRLFCDSE